jgi:hypothetical protein
VVTGEIGKRRLSSSKAQDEVPGDGNEAVELSGDPLKKSDSSVAAQKAAPEESNDRAAAADEEMQMYIDSNGVVKRKMSKSMIPTQVASCALSSGANYEPIESGLVPPTPGNHHHNHQHQLVRIQPAIPSNANIRNILENVTKTEGPFKEPEEAIRAAIAAFTQDAW